MTTIAIDKNSVSCDLQFTHSNGMKFKGNSKCVVLEPPVAKAMFDCDKAIIGACGDADSMAKAWGFLADPTMFEGKVPKIKGVEFVALTAKKEILTSANLISWIEIVQPFYAIGSGCHIAVGAMANGADTKKAVELAAKHDVNTGMGIKTYKL